MITLIPTSVLVYASSTFKDMKGLLETCMSGDRNPTNMCKSVLLYAKEGNTSKIREQ